MWETSSVENGSSQDIHLPKQILNCAAVTREIHFSSQEQIQRLCLYQKVLFHCELIEQWSFEFGFVIPKSANTWQNEVIADNNVLSAKELSGNVLIETIFMAEDKEVHRSTMRVWYE